MALKGQKGYIPKKRGSNSRQRKSIILLATEGNNKTEALYFRDYGRAKGRIVRFTPGNYTDPVNMVSALSKEYEELSLDPELGDKAYCLVDADTNAYKNNQIARADNLARKKGVQVLVSVPCFEVWYLCHFVCSSTHYQSNEAVIDSLCKHIPGYQKNMDGIYDALSSKTVTAVLNAKSLEESCSQAGYSPHTVEFSPSTEVYRIAEELGV